MVVILAILLQEIYLKRYVNDLGKYYLNKHLIRYG